MADIILHFHTGNQCSNGFGHHSTCPEPTWRYICGDLGGGLWGCTHYPPFSKEVADVLDKLPPIEVPFDPKAPEQQRYKGPDNK